MKYNGVVISTSKNEVKVTFCQKKNLLYLLFPVILNAQLFLLQQILYHILECFVYYLYSLFPTSTL